MGTTHTGISVVKTSAQHDATDSAYWGSLTCPRCGPSQFLTVACSVDAGNRHDGLQAWLRCVSCRGGIVVNGGVVSPGATTIAVVDGCPEDVERAWAEVRADLTGGAATSAVMMCRKILFHIAVEKGLPAQDERGRAPSFEQCLKHLREVGLLTPPLEPWVQRIKDVGNQANHELEQIAADEAQRVATFTRQLLITTYEMPHMMNASPGSS